MSQKFAVLPKSSNPPLTWVMVALLGHTFWGAYPVFGRYLQTVSNLPSMSLLVLGNSLALLTLGLFMGKNLSLQHFKHPILLLFAAIVAVRGISNLLATRYTLAIYVQLITLMTPFLVALMSWTLLREKLPRYTFSALSLTSLGAVMMVSGKVDQSMLQSSLTSSDWLGIALAFGSSFALASYMILVRQSNQYRITTETIFVVQLLALVVFSAITSLILQEDWSRWTKIGPMDWLVFFAFTLGVLVSANLAQISSIRHIGATLVSSIMPWRLVSALIVGAILLNEKLSSVWQVLGAVVVLVTLSWYLWQQNNN